MANPNPPNAPIRCFAALPLPDAVKSALIHQRERLQAGYGRAGVRWVEADHMHLTLRFLGNVEAQQIPAVTEALAAAANTNPRFSLRTHQLGCFPNARFPKVIWIGVEGDLPWLHRLQSAVVAATRPWGDAPVEKVYTPHLTLGRVKTIPPCDLAYLRSAMEQLPALTSVAWKSESLALFHGPVTLASSELASADTSPLTQIK